MKHFLRSLLNKIWIAVIIFFMVLLVNYLNNEQLIRKYYDEIYEDNKLSVLGFLEPYVAPFNKGNNYFQQEYYEAASEEYEKALELNPPEDKDCRIRINMALAMVTPIDPEEVTLANLEDYIDILDEAREVLYENGCATEEGDGHDKEAQELADDIDDFEEELREKVQPPEEQDPNQDGNDSNQNPNGSGEEDNPEDNPEDEDSNGGSAEEQLEQEVMEQLQDLQREGMQDRTSYVEQMEMFDSYDWFDSYDGDVW